MTFERHAFHHTRAMPFMAVVLLSGCTVYEPPAIQASQGSSTSTTSVALTAPDETQVNRVAFHGALSNVFASRGISIADTAPVVADFSISTSPADVALLASEAGKTENPPQPIADPRKPNWTDGCKATRVRATLALFDRASGNLMQSSTAHATICADSTPPYEEMATTLIADALPN